MGLRPGAGNRLVRRAGPGFERVNHLEPAVRIETAVDESQPDREPAGRWGKRQRFMREFSRVSLGVSGRGGTGVTGQVTKTVGRIDRGIRGGLQRVIAWHGGGCPVQPDSSGKER